MTILVTGGAGFIGSHIVDILVNVGHKVIIVDNLAHGKKEQVSSGATFYNEDINSKHLMDIFKKERPDYVIHQAAQVSVQSSIDNPLFDAHTNIQGTINLLQCCVKYKVRKIIYASSAAVYGLPQYLGIDENHPIQPISYYGASKYVPELYLDIYAKLHGLCYTILRYANVYGERQDPCGEGGVVSIFIDKLLVGEQPTIYGDGKQTRDFIYVRDIARANILALDQADNDVVNISSNQQTTVWELLNIICQVMDMPVQPTYESPRKGDIMHSYLENSKAKQLLGWEPKHTLYDGLQETIDYYRELKSK